MRAAERVGVGGLGCGDLAAAAGVCRGWAAALEGEAAGRPGRLGLGRALADRLLGFPLATPPGQAAPWEPPRRRLRLEGSVSAAAGSAAAGQRGAGDQSPAPPQGGEPLAGVEVEPFTPSPGPAAAALGGVGASSCAFWGGRSPPGEESALANVAAGPSGLERSNGVGGPEPESEVLAAVEGQFEELLRGRAFVGALEVMAPGVPPALLTRTLAATEALSELRLEDAGGECGLHDALVEALAGGACSRLRRLELSLTHVRRGEELQPLLSHVGRLPELQTLALGLSLPPQSKAGSVKDLWVLRAGCRLGSSEVRLLAAGGAPLRHLSLQRVAWSAGLAEELAEAFPALQALQLESPREAVGGDDLLGGVPGGDGLTELAAFPALERAALGSLVDLPDDKALGDFSAGATSLQYLELGLSFQPAASSLRLLRQGLPLGLEEVYVSWVPVTQMHGADDGEVFWQGA